MRDLSEQGQTFLDRSGGENTIVYSVPTPLGYRVYIARQRLQHVRDRHRSAAQKIKDIPQILTHPDIIVPDYDKPDTHLYYKAYGQRLLAMVIHIHLGRRYLATMHWDMNIKGLGLKRIVSSDFLYNTRWIQVEKVEISIAGEVVEFIFKQSKDEFFTDEGHPGLMVGRDWKSHEVIGYMSYDLPALYGRILEGLRQNPIPGRFTIVAVSEAGHPVPLTDEGMTDLDFAEVVKWTYRTCFADKTAPTSAEVSQAPIKEKVLAERQEGYVAGEASEDAPVG